MHAHNLIKILLEEYNLEISDIRWFLSNEIGKKIKNLFTESPDKLSKYIWSGELEADLYNMEERYIEEITELYERELMDEAGIREQFAAASAKKCARF